MSAAMGLGPRRYVRSAAVAGDQKTYDIGKIFVISNNETGTTTIGKLWLEYDFEFFTPQNDPAPNTAPAITSFYTLNASQTFTTTVAAALNWDTLVFDPLGIGAGASGVFTPPAGVYRIEVQITGHDSANEEYTLVLAMFKNGAALSKAAGSENQIAGTGNNSFASNTLFAVVPCNGTDTFQIQCTMSGAAGTLTAAGTQCQMIVSLA
jgi:hypothetical protein